MHELTTTNAVELLRAWGWIGPEPATVETLGGGVSNVVLRVRTPRSAFVVKQSRPQLRTRAAWFSDIERIHRERQAMETLAPLLPPGAVPLILFSAPHEYAFAMSQAPQEARVWKEMLLAGEVDPILGQRAGALLGRLHQATAGGEAVDHFADAKVFEQLRTEPFYLRVREQHPDTAALLDRLVERLRTVRDALCHGDFSPKNLLVHDGAFTLVDYETVYGGDPTMDLGFCLSHLLLKAVKRSAERERYFDLVRSFVRGYEAEVRFRPLAELEAAGVGHAGVCLLARIDGTSPVDYLVGDEPRRTAARSLGRRVLLDGLRRWEEVLAVAEKILHGVAASGLSPSRGIN
jgi:5-methylthioribose kinase